MAAVGATSDTISKYVLACKKNNVKRPNPQLVKFFQEEEPTSQKAKAKMARVMVAKQMAREKHASSVA